MYQYGRGNWLLFLNFITAFMALWVLRLRPDRSRTTQNLLLHLLRSQKTKIPLLIRICVCVMYARRVGTDSVQVIWWTRIKDETEKFAYNWQYRLIVRLILFSFAFFRWMLHLILEVYSHYFTIGIFVFPSRIHEFIW